MRKPEISMWFVLYLIFSYLVVVGFGIYQNAVIQKQRQLIKQLYQDSEKCILGRSRA